MHFESPSYQRMLKARVVAVKELLTPPLGPRAGLKEGAGDAIYKKTHHQRVPTNRCSDIPEATTHEGSTTPGSGATPSRSSEIADPS